MPPHRMHLKGPWETVPLSAIHPEQSLPAPETKKLPASWQELFGQFAGTVSFRRYFQKPTNLDANEQVFIVLDGITGTVERITVNDIPLTPNGAESRLCPGGYEITPLLQQRNQLRIDVQFSPASTSEPGGLWGPVALEIHQA